MEENNIQGNNNNSKTSSNRIFNSEIHHNKPRKRKMMIDNITKRVKSDFLRSLVRYLNEKLRPLNVKFSHFSYYIVTNITKLENKKNLNMTLKEMLLYKPFENLNISEGLNQREILNWKNNKDILDDLEKNKNTDVYNQINLDDTLNNKMKDLYYEYLASKYFKESIETLNAHGNEYEYIQKYIQTAKNFVDFFYKRTKNDNKNYINKYNTLLKI